MSVNIHVIFIRARQSKNIVELASSFKTSQIIEYIITNKTWTLTAKREEKIIYLYCGVLRNRRPSTIKSLSHYFIIHSFHKHIQSKYSVLLKDKNCRQKNRVEKVGLCRFLSSTEFKKISKKHRIDID